MVRSVLYVIDDLIGLWFELVMASSERDFRQQSTHSFALLARKRRFIVKLTNKILQCLPSLAGIFSSITSFASGLKKFGPGCATFGFSYVDSKGGGTGGGVPALQKRTNSVKATLCSMQPFQG
jgi:hypothetical protein